MNSKWNQRFSHRFWWKFLGISRNLKVLYLILGTTSEKVDSLIFWNFLTASRSSIQLSESANPSKQAEKRKQTPRVLRTFADSRRVVAEQKMHASAARSRYVTIQWRCRKIDTGTADHPGKKKLSLAADAESVTSGFQESFSSSSPPTIRWELRFSSSFSGFLSSLATLKKLYSDISSASNFWR
jgi:hypothetical protein